ncbi:MAG: NADH:ubiquinone oxidoreductase [Roseovarius sp.]
MSDTSKLSTCQIVCWGLSGLVGLIVLWAATGAVGFLAALLLAIAIAVLLGLASTRLVCTGDAASVSEADAAPTPEPTPAPDPAPAAEPTASAATAEPPAQPDAPATAVRSGTTLAGEEELASRKGVWRYEGGATAQPDAARPAALDGPRDGKADDLKRIKGVGPKLEKVCNELGFYHFDQIANWTEAEIAWVDDNLKGFKGRVSRDNWVEQAKTLAAGGETEFSARVDKGDVY